MAKPKLPPLSSLRPIIPRSLRSKIDASTSTESGAETRRRAVPFFRNPDHTRPTKSLYRDLIRFTRLQSSDSAAKVGQDRSRQVTINWAALRRDIKENWKKRKGLTSIPQTQIFLEKQSNLLHLLSSSDPNKDEILSTLSKTLSSRQDGHDKRSITPKLPKPYLAGYLRPTHFHPPLPRLKPQPISLSLMIKKRIAARARRLELQRNLIDVVNDIQGEIGFMRRLHLREGLEDMKEFRDAVGVLKDRVQDGYERDERRKGGVFGVGVVRRVEKARRARQEWKRLKAEQRGREGTEVQQRGTAQ